MLSVPSENVLTVLAEFWLTSIVVGPPITTLFPTVIVPLLPAPLARSWSVPALRVNAPVPNALRDRKSTRLNSSHTVISYAVFCLKKKKNKKHTLREKLKKYRSYESE